VLDDALTAAPTTGIGEVPRWELYRLLSDPLRMRMLALVAVEELAVGELAELLGEGQPKVSRHGAALRDAGLVSARRNGTWVLLKLAPTVASDAVVSDALSAGMKLVTDDGTRARVDGIVRSRDDKAREYFARAQRGPAASAEGGLPRELLAYAAALGPLISPRALAVDAGTGDGALLDILSPIFTRVVAVDRSEAQLAAARSRAAARGMTNVDFVQSELDGGPVESVVKTLAPRGADVVFASRVLHHAPKPGRAVRALAGLLRAPSASTEGGALVILDYAPHEDLAMKEAQADLWLGFDEAELSELAREARMTGIQVTRIPPQLRGDGPDAHLEWTVLFGRRGAHHLWTETSSPPNERGLP